MYIALQRRGQKLIGEWTPKRHSILWPNGGAVGVIFKICVKIDRVITVPHRILQSSKSMFYLRRSCFIKNILWYRINLHHLVVVGKHRNPIWREIRVKKYCQSLACSGITLIDLPICSHICKYANVSIYENNATTHLYVCYRMLYDRCYKSALYYIVYRFVHL